jgi:hypothetical protein
MWPSISGRKGQFNWSFYLKKGTALGDKTGKYQQKRCFFAVIGQKSSVKKWTENSKKRKRGSESSQKLF